MKTRAVLACWLLAFMLSTPALAAKNAVYKGSYSITDLVTGKVKNLSLYLVFGEETPVNPPEDRYTYLTGKFVIVNGLLGKKRFGVTSAGDRFRSVEKAETVGGKTRITEIITQAGDGHATDSGNGYHSLDGLVLIGRLGNLKYDFPVTLKGYGLNASGSLGVLGNPPSGSAIHSSLSFTLVQSITDPIPSGESLDATVERVTNFLKTRGYIEYAP